MRGAAAVPARLAARVKRARCDSASTLRETGCEHAHTADRVSAVKRLGRWFAGTPRHRS
jgi:hypothetical protein